MTEFIQFAILKNKWLWFHCLGGAALALFFILGLTWSGPLSVAAVGGIAIAWELFEALTQDLEAVYGSRKYFLYDAIGDIAGALICGLIITWLV